MDMFYKSPRVNLGRLTPLLQTVTKCSPSAVTRTTLSTIAVLHAARESLQEVELFCLALSSVSEGSY